MDPGLGRLSSLLFTPSEAYDLPTEEAEEAEPISKSIPPSPLPDSLQRYHFLEVVSALGKLVR